MALRPYYEGTPQNLSVQPFDPTNPKFWESGAIGMLDVNGNIVVSDGTAAYGLLADRRSATVGLTFQTYLPSTPGQYGDQSAFNQPGPNNGLYGTGAVIPPNTIPTTTLLRDDTAINPNVSQRKCGVYKVSGLYGTDQFDPAQTYVPGTLLYVMTDGTGRVTNQGGANAIPVGTTVNPVDDNGVLVFNLSLV